MVSKRPCLNRGGPAGLERVTDSTMSRKPPARLMLARREASSLTRFRTCGGHCLLQIYRRETTFYAAIGELAECGMSSVCRREVAGMGAVRELERAGLAAARWAIPFASGPTRQALWTHRPESRQPCSFGNRRRSTRWRSGIPSLHRSSGLVLSLQHQRWHLTVAPCPLFCRTTSFPPYHSHRCSCY